MNKKAVRDGWGKVYSDALREVAEGMEQSGERPTLLQMAQSVGHPRGFYGFKAAPPARHI